MELYSENTEYQKLLEIVQDIKDIEAIETAQAEEQELFPLDVVERLANAENSIKVFR